MSIYNSQSPFNQGAKRSEIKAANKQRRQSRRQRVKDIKEAGGPEFYSADGYHVGEFDKKGRNMQYPEKRYSKKNPPNKGISGADMMSMQFHGYTDVPDSDERKSPMNQAVKSIKPTIKRQQLTVPLPKPKVKVYKSVSSRLVKEKPLPIEQLPLQPHRIMPTINKQQKVYKSVGERYKNPSKKLPMERMKELSNPVEYHVESRIQKVSPMNQGDIKQAPSKLTQAYRRFKNDESGPYNMARNLATAAVALAPLPIGKINAVKKVGKAFSNAPKQYLKGKNMTSIPNPIPNSTKAYNKLQTYKSKPVDYMGPNPAHKIGAGKNSYPK